MGPILGWTREERGLTVSRLWAKADDTYSGRAVLALTARWDGTRASEVLFWKVHPVHLRDTQPPAVERFALGDVNIPPAGQPVRMVMLHIHAKTGDEELPAEYGRAYHAQSLGAQPAVPEPTGGVQGILRAGWTRLRTRRRTMRQGSSANSMKG